MVSSLVFTVRRQQPVLVAPAKPTPYEFKPLSDIDDQEGLRFQAPVLQFYRNHSSSDMAGRDPAQVIREALSKALVFYYPFAGRLREWPGRKLVVECTGEGVLFTEADAEITLDQFGDALRPPFPCFDELLYDVPGSDGIVNCPLILIQVTRLKCGGFVLALRINHTMSDAPGLVQFLNAIAELARGALSPSTSPVWDRHLLCSRDPPRVTRIHREYEELPDDGNNRHGPPFDVARRSFFFRPGHIAALRRLLPLSLRSSATTFDLITAALWRCRTAALAPHPSEEVKICCIVNARGHGKLKPLLPAGYYGNAFVYPAAASKAGDLCRNPLGYAVALVMGAKSDATQEYVRSVADFMVLHGRPHFGVVRNIVVSDVRNVGFRDVDFGWGRAVFGGPEMGSLGFLPPLTFYISAENAYGENGILLPIALPHPAMNRFFAEMERLTAGPPEECVGPTRPSELRSSL